MGGLRMADVDDYKAKFEAAEKSLKDNTDKLADLEATNKSLVEEKTTLTKDLEAAKRKPVFKHNGETTDKGLTNPEVQTGLPIMYN